MIYLNTCWFQKYAELQKNFVMVQLIVESLSLIGRVSVYGIQQSEDWFLMETNLSTFVSQQKKHFLLTCTCSFQLLKMWLTSSLQGGGLCRIFYCPQTFWSCCLQEQDSSWVLPLVSGMCLLQSADLLQFNSGLQDFGYSTEISGQYVFFSLWLLVWWCICRNIQPSPSNEGY